MCSGDMAESPKGCALVSNSTPQRPQDSSSDKIRGLNQVAESYG
jgi:hypothetical protein